MVQSSETCSELAGIGIRAVLVNDEASWADMFSRLTVARQIAFDTETTCLDHLAHHFDVVGISLAVDATTGYYIPLNHTLPAQPIKSKIPASLPLEDKNKLRHNQVGQGLLFYPGSLQPAEKPTQLPVDWVIRQLQPLLETREIMGHGLKFDYQAMLVKYGIKIKVAYDTICAAHLVDERFSLRLKDLSERYLGYKPMRFEEAVGDVQDERSKDRRARSNFELVPINKACVYAAPDAVNTVRLRAAFRPILMQHPQFVQLMTTEVADIPITAKMELIGTKLNTSHLSAMNLEIQRLISEKREIIRQIVGMPKLNVASQAQMCEVLYDKIMLAYPGKRKAEDKDTRKGMLTSQTLDKIIVNVRSDTKGWCRGKCKIARQSVLDLLTTYQDIAHLDKLAGTYTTSLIDAVSDDGRLHTLYHQQGAKSGRYSSSSPSFQTIPRNTNPEDITYSYDIRKAFQAGFDHDPEPWVYVLADYSAMEMCICAALSGCQAMRDIILGNKRDAGGNRIDLHLYTACSAFGLHYEECVSILKDKKNPKYREIKEKRQQAKTVNFGIIYGITEFGLAAGLNQTLEFALSLKSGFMRAFPGVAQWMERTRAYLLQNLYTETYFGRRRRISYAEKMDKDAFNKAFRACLNHQIQGTGADIVKKAMVKVANRLKANNLRAEISGQIHDEIVTHCPESEHKIVAQIMVEEMATVIEGIPIVAEAEVKRTWSKMEDPMLKIA